MSKTNELIDQAKKLINDYYIKDFLGDETEFDYDVDFSDLSNISVACTDLEDEINGDSHEVQVTIDLTRNAIVTEIDGYIVSDNEYSTLEEFIRLELEWLDFDSLVSISDEEWDVFFEKKFNTNN